MENYNKIDFLSDDELCDLLKSTLKDLLEVSESIDYPRNKKKDIKRSKRYIEKLIKKLESEDLEDFGR